MKVLFRACGCYRRLVKKILHLVAINKGPNILAAASSITEAFQVIDVFHPTLLINLQDGVYSAVPFYVPGSHEYVSRIFFSDLGEHSRTVTCLRTELAEVKKPRSRTHEIRGPFDECF